MQTKAHARANSTLSELWTHRTLYLMCVPALLLLLAFCYIPMSGIWMAFTKFNVVDGIFGSPFVGLDNFFFFFKNPMAQTVIYNTLFINFFGILLGTAAPILIAICMKEISGRVFRKFFQSAMFFPYFLSWIVVGAILYGFFTANFRVNQQTGEIIVNGANGVMNQLLMAFGAKPIRWYAMPQYWKGILILVNVWKWAGYSSIIYMAAMSGFDASLYEAAAIDGASRFQCILRITIPMLKPTVIVLTLMSIGRIFYGDFGMIYGIVGNNPVLSEAVSVIDTYVYGAMRSMGFSYTTAIGLMQSILGLCMVLGANALAKRVNDGEGLF